MSNPPGDGPRGLTHEELTVQVAWNNFLIRCLIAAGSLVTALAGTAITLLTLYVAHVKVF